MNAKTKTVALVAISIMVIAGCVTTSVKGYTDRDYKNFQIKKVAVRAPNSSFSFADLLENSMVEELKKKGVSAESFVAMFTPTRKWINKEVSTELIENGFDTVIYINLAGSNMSSHTVGYINNGSASVYGNNASFNSSSIAMTAITRFTSARIHVYEVRTGDVIWIGDTDTKGDGLLFLGDKQQTDSIAAKTVEALEGSGHIQER